MRKQLATLATAAALAAALTLFGCKEEKAKTPEAAADTVPQAEAAEVSYLISTAGVGVFQLGKSIPLDSKDYTFEGEHCFEECDEWNAYLVHQDGQHVLTIQIDIDYGDIAKSRKNNIIRGITVSSNKFATAEGVRVGSTVEEFAKAYPNSTIEYLGDYSGDYSISTRGKNYHIYAILSPESFAVPKDNDNIKLSNVKGAKIQSIDVAVPIQAEQEANAEAAEESDYTKYEKLQKKGDIYYLDSKPFTGKAKQKIMGEYVGTNEEWEMKDGKLHGKYGYFSEDYSTTGTYKDGKKDGEWMERWPFEDKKIIQQYKDGNAIKTETYENDKLIKTEEAGAGVYAGQAIKEFVAAFEKQYTVKKEFQEGGEDSDAYDVYRVYENKELLFEVYFNSDDKTKVGGVVVLSPKIKTDRGIGVGAAIKDVQAKYDYDGRICDDGDACEVKDFSGFFGFKQRNDYSWYLRSIGLSDSLMLTADLRIIKKPEASK